VLLLVVTLLQLLHHLCCCVDTSLCGPLLQILNVVAEEVLEGHPLSERKLKEVLGHTPRQVRTV